MITTHDELRNLVALAIDPDAWSTIPFAGFYSLMPREMPREKADAYWWKRCEPDREKSLLIAERILDAVKSAELAVVPMEATEDMMYEARDRSMQATGVVNAAIRAGNVLEDD